jgi:DNA-binding beta-propeller fold protein YncE
VPALQINSTQLAEFRPTFHTLLRISQALSPAFRPGGSERRRYAYAPNIYNAAVTVEDTGNQSTPAATAISDPGSVSTNSLTVNPALAISPITLPNALLNYPYPTIPTAATISATGGLGGNTWLAPGATATGACASPTGNFPPGSFALASTSTTASVTGTPSTASPSAGFYAFQVCVTDTGNSMTSAGFALPNTSGNDLAIDVMNTYGYTAETSANEVEVVNTSTKATVTTIPTGSGTAPYGVAFSPSGRYAYVTLSGTDQLAIFDTITDAQTTSPASPIALAGCTAPHGVAATSAFVFIACNGTGNIAVVDTTAFGENTIATDHTNSQPEGITIRADNLRVYATLSAENELFTIDNSGASPVALAGTGDPFTLLTTDGTIPFGIAAVPNGAGTLAYIAKQGASGTVPDGIEIVTLTNDAFASSSSVVTSVDSSAIPTYVAASPDGSVVYVTLAGADKFAVFANNAAPAQITGSPFTLATAAAGPQGVTIPVLSPVPPATGYLVFISQDATNNLAVIDNLSPPVADGTPTIALAGTAPAAIASTPAPQ